MNPYLSNSGAGSRLRWKRTRARVEIVPLIDVMFLLVAFFMVVTMSMVMQRGIGVDLAPAETGNPLEEDADELVLSVDENGTYFLDKKELTDSELLSQLRGFAEIDTDRTVKVDVDEEARHKSLIKALDILRKSGLHNVVFSVEPE